VHGDAVTAALERAPLAEVVAAIAEQAGAELRGEIAPPRDVSLELSAVALEDALERLLGEQSFTLTYHGDGRLKRITLGGEARRRPATPSGAPTHANLLAPEAANDEVASAVRRVHEFIQGDRTVPVRGRLAQVLGTNTSTFTQVFDAGFKHADPRVRALGRRITIKALVADPEVRRAFVTMVDSTTDETLVQALRNLAGPDAEQAAMAFARLGRSPVLTRRMHRALADLRAQRDGG
jgi:hypothetical protein